MSYAESEQIWPEWIGKQRIRFIMQGYTVEDVAMLARLADFHPMWIAFKLSHFNDVLAGTNTDARVNRQISWVMAEISKTSLDDQWKALGRKLCEGRDFDD